MARVELNIVALGDFSSVNTQIANLKTQVELLNKSLIGVGLSSNLQKQLTEANNAFKATMLSTGQYTAQTVKLKTETENFGQALVNGKLKVKEYFDIINAGTTNATAQMKALALEQTKLQNSIVTSDPTKQGVMTVFTPTKNNEIANATKIATNMQNIYNIAVQKGTQELINWGKNTQWAGRQLTVGMTVPLTIFGSTAIKTFQDVNTEIVRLQKVYGTGLTQPTTEALTQIKDQVLGLSKELASSLGIAVKDTTSMAADLAAVGLQGQDLINSTREAMRLQKLGEMSTQDALQTTISLQNVYKLNTEQLAGAVNFLNAVENQTSTSLQDLATAIPKVGPIVQQLGGSFKDTAVMMVAMKEAGVPAAQSANAIKSSIASLINPTKAAKDAFAAYNINVGGIAKATGGNPVKMIEALQQSLKGLQPLVQAQLIEKLFGKFQEARIQALITNLGAVNSQTKTAFDLMNASDMQLSAIAQGELKTAAESTTGKFKRAVETMKADLLPIGEKIMSFASILLNFGNSIAKVFSGLPGPVKVVLGIIAAGVALAGPLIMFTGVLANFVGYIMKGFFSLVQLKNGTKSFGDLFTPEIIASQNAAELFSTKILEDESAIALLNTAVRELTINLEGMAAAMGLAARTNLGTNMTNILEKLPGMSKGGIVPGSGNTDSVPVMLTPGEIVIPKSQVPGRGNTGRIGKSAYTLSERYKTNVAQGTDTVSFSNLSPTTANLADMYSPHILEKAGTNTNQINAEILAWQKQNSVLIKKATDALKSGVSSEEAFAEITAKFKIDMESAQGPVHKFVTTAKLLAPQLETDLKEAQLYAQQYSLDMKESASVAQMAAALPNNIIAQGMNTPGNFQRYAKTRAASQAMLSNSAAYKTTGVPRFMTQGITTGDPMYGEMMSQGHFSRNSTQEANLLKQQQLRNSQIEKNVATALNQESQSQSPSRVTKQAAKNIVDGVVVGLKEGETRVTQQSAEMMGPSMENGSFTSNTGAQTGWRSKVFNSSGKMNMMSKIGGGSALMMGGQMLGGMLPQGSVANNMLSTTSNLAGMGMMFGAGGAIAGAAIGAAFSGITALIGAHKKQQEAAQAAFKESSFAAQMFGNATVDATTPVANLTASIDSMGKKTDKVAADTQFFVDQINKLPKNDPMSLILDKLKGADSTGASRIAKAFSDTQIAINGMDPLKAQQMLDLYLRATGHADLVGTVKAAGNISSATKEYLQAGGEAASTKETVGVSGYRVSGSFQTGGGVAKTYSELNKNAQDAADKIAKVANETANSKTMDEFNQKLKGISSSFYDTKNGAELYSMAIEQQSKKVGDANDKLAKQVKTLSDMGLTLSQIIALNKDPEGNAIVNKLVADQKAGDLKAVAADMDLINKAIAKALAQKPSTSLDLNNGGGNGAGSTGPTALDTAYDKIIKNENTWISIIQKRIKAQNDSNTASQRAQDLAMSQTDIANQIKQKIATGDYLGANLLRQQSLNLQDKYNQQVVTDQNQAILDAAQNKVAELQQGKTDKTAITAAIAKLITDAGIKDVKPGKINIPSSSVGGASGAIGIQTNNANYTFNITSSDPKAAAQEVMNILKLQNAKNGTTYSVGGK